MAKPARQACVGCHFFVKEYRENRPPLTFAVDAREREASRAGDYSWHKDYQALACYMGVWDEGVGEFNLSPKHDLIVETERSGFCFFWQYRPGMLMGAAKILQERESSDREASRDRRLTVIGLWIAAVALLISLCLDLIYKLAP